MKMPVKQKHHNYINPDIMPWIDLHFPSDSAFQGRIFIGKHTKDSEFWNVVTRRNFDELKPFINEMHVSKNLDYYISANSVSGVKLVNDQVFGLQNIVIDIDCHDDALNVSEKTASFVWYCLRDLWNTDECPTPNSIVYTGRGLQLWWALDAAHVSLKNSYRRMQSWLASTLQTVIDEHSEFSGLSVDKAASSRLAGWYRLPLTYNTKTNRVGQLNILHFDRFELPQMLEKYVPSNFRVHALPEKKYDWVLGENTLENKPQEYIALAKDDAIVLTGGTTAMAARVEKIIKLRSIRKASIGNEQRDLMCLIVYCALLADYSPAEAWKRLLAFNNGFKEPLSIAELERSMKTATEKKYSYKNETIIDVLNITEEEQERIGLYAYTGDNVKRRKKNSTRDSIRQTLKEDRNNKVISLYLEGINKSEIARRIEISRNTVITIIKAYEALRIENIGPEETLNTDTEPNTLPMAAGAENCSNTIEGCAKTVPIYIVSYPMSLSDGQPIVESRFLGDESPPG